MSERDPDEYVPCPRHGTRCFREIPDLRQRIECAIGLGDRGPAGVKATAERIMMMIEDSALDRPLAPILPLISMQCSGEGRALVDFPADMGPDAVARFRAAWIGGPVEYRQAGEKLDD